MSKYNILIADESSVIRSMVISSFSEKQFNLEEASDGFEVASKVFSHVYDVLVISENISIISSFDLVRMIKENEKLSKIKIVVYSSCEERQLDFLYRENEADIFVDLDSGSASKVVSAVEDLLKDVKSIEDTLAVDKKQQKKQNILTDKEVACKISQMYIQDSSYQKIQADLFKASTQINDLTTHITTILSVLAETCPYDIALLLIKDGDNVHQFCRMYRNFERSEKADFLKVCHDGFEDNCDASVDHEYMPVLFEQAKNLPSYKSTTKKIRSYEIGILFTESFIGTVHIGSVSTNAYNDDTRGKLIYFTEHVGPLIDIALKLRQTEQRERQLRRAFSSFIPDEIVDEVIKSSGGKDEFTGEKRRVAVLICDIRKFTTISELNKPETVVSFLNDYFSSMVDIVRKNGGSIDKFMGDAIMALFGATKSYEDNAKRAVNAAIEMCKIADFINKSALVMPKDTDFKIGIGIHYGEVILGRIGCREKSDYTVIGDSVNLTSRLEGLTKQYETKIIITEPVKTELNDEYSLRKLDRVKVKGKSIPVMIYSVETDSKKYDAEYKRNYEKAMDMYIIGAWKLAGEYFKKALAFCPDDKAASLMITRCAEFVEKPPESWDGATTLTAK